MGVIRKYTRMYKPQQLSIPLTAHFWICGAILSMFYESIHRRCGSVAVPVVYGRHSRGKTIFLKIALAVCGNLEKGLLSFLTESSSHFKMGESLPFAYDDPNNSEIKFKQMLIEAFGGGSIENSRLQMSARCVCTFDQCMPTISFWTGCDHSAIQLIDSNPRLMRLLRKTLGRGHQSFQHTVFITIT